MPAKQMLHVLTDRTGRIIGASLVDGESELTDGVRTQVTPLEGQRLVKTKLTPELGKLESAEDFQRLSTEFHLPRGRTELARKRAGAPRKKKRRRAS
jgi:hypothetical protein